MVGNTILQDLPILEAGSVPDTDILSALFSVEAAVVLVIGSSGIDRGVIAVLSGISVVDHTAVERLAPVV